MASDHENFWTSITKFCQQSITDMGSSAIFQDFDTHSQMDQLPQQDMVGTANLHWINDEHFYTVMCSIGVSTFEDQNLFRHRKMIGWLGERLKPMSTLRVYNSDSGSDIGWMAVQGGISLLPMAKTDRQSLQFLMVSFQTSLTA